MGVSPDYKYMSEEEALADVRKRVGKYEEVYETVDDDSLSYIKLYNFSSKVLANQIYGRMSKTVIPALMAWHIGQRPIYLCRAGKTEDVIEADGTVTIVRSGRLDSEGFQFRDALCKYFFTETCVFQLDRGQQYLSSIKTRRGTCHNNSCAFSSRAQSKDGHTSGKIMSSTMPRALETATWNELELPMDVLSNLNPLDKGDFSGKELSEIEKLDPVWYSMLECDPYNTRFPGGECYHDLINRLESCVIDMEQQVVPVLVVSHVSVIQVLLSYFRNTPIEKCTSIEVPMNTVIKISPVNGGGWTESQIPLLHKSKPS